MFDDYEDDLFGDPVDDMQDEQAQENEVEDSGYYHEEDDVFGENDNSESEQKSSDFIDRMLRERGIDKNKIRFENDNGEIEEVDFDSLTEEEKYDLINNQELPISDQEINDLNQLRRMKMSLTDYTDYLRQQAVQEYLAQNSTPRYEVDSLNDDEVFVLDLMQRFGEDLSNEEIDAELDRAKENTDMFTKQVASIRNRMKATEEAEAKRTQAEADAQQKQQFNEFVNEMVSAAQNVHELQGVELDDTDRERILDFLLEENPQGRTGFSELLSDPEQIFKMAWFALYGEQAFNSTLDYFKNELSKARRGADKQTAPKTVRKPSRQPSKQDDPYDIGKYFTK